jgi:hypothetical protein
MSKPTTRATASDRPADRAWWIQWVRDTRGQDHAAADLKWAFYVIFKREHTDEEDERGLWSMLDDRVSRLDRRLTPNILRPNFRVG